MTNPLTERRAALTLLAISWLAAAPPLAAAEIETPAEISAAVRSAIAPRLATIKEASVELEIGAIDARLQLPFCPDIKVTLPPTNTAVITAKVGCDGPNWTIYVPVRLHAWVEAVVAATNLPPNAKLTSDNLSRGRVDMFSSNGGLVTDAEQAEGKILKVGLLAGSPVLAPFLDLPIVVHRGQKVLLTLTANTMMIKAIAVALEDGRVGDSIALENPDSKKTMHATVAEDGSVEMNF